MSLLRGQTIASIPGGLASSGFSCSGGSDIRINSACRVILQALNVRRFTSPASDLKRFDDLLLWVTLCNLVTLADVLALTHLPETAR
jgi:hypothetical protein